MSKNILFLDTETTGLPKDWKAPYDQWPRLVQLSYIVTDEFGKIIIQKDQVIKPVGFTIPEESSKIHGITQERALREGVDLKTALEELDFHLGKVYRTVMHNLSFDTAIVAGEQMRMGWPDYGLITNQVGLFCTMKKSKDIVKAKNKLGHLKMPNLAELCAFCGIENKGAHNSLNDVLATKDCYFYMVDKGHF
jgi:DNA polymerase III epsilon subunit-like protein